MRRMKKCKPNYRRPLLTPSPREKTAFLQNKLPVTAPNAAPMPKISFLQNKQPAAAGHSPANRDSGPGVFSAPMFLQLLE